MTKNFDYIDCRFHRVSNWTWLRVRELLQGALLARLRAGSDNFVFNIGRDDFETVLDLIEQMDIGYIHPRRDALHVSLLSTMYASLHVPSSYAHRDRMALICSSRNDKKPKSNN